MIAVPCEHARTYLLLQLQPLPIESLLGFLPSFSKKSSFEFVCRSVSQRVDEALQPLHLSIADLDGSSQLHVVLPRQALADGCYLAELFLVEFGPQVSERYSVFVLLELPSLPLLLEPLAELTHLDDQAAIISQIFTQQKGNRGLGD